MIYLTAEDVLTIHSEAMGCEEDDAERRLIRRSGLEGAVARPMWHEHFGDPDIAHLAAVLAHGLAEGQLFIDGKKRTAFLAMAVFLERSGYELHASGEQMASWIIELSAGGSVEQLAERVRAAL